MNVGDALGVIGPVSLDVFPWGQTVIGIVNSHLSSLPEEDRPDLHSTGTEVLEALDKLDADQKAMILAIDLGVLGKTTVDVVRQEAVPGRVDSAKRARNIFVIMIGGLITLMAVVVTLAWYNTSLSSGQMPSTDDLQGILKIAVEIFRIIYGDSSGSQ